MACCSASAVLLLVVVAAAAAQQARIQENAACRTKSNEKGSYRKLTQCTSLLEGIRQGVEPDIAAFVGFTPVVCCPAAAASSTQRTTGRATQKNAATTPRSTASTRETTASTTARAVTTRSKSEQKCAEWGRAVFRLEESPVLLPGSPKVNVSLCAGKGAPYIIGGVPAEPKEFPHMAGIGFGPDNNLMYMCGGSLISERWVLTAAHCTEDFPNRGIGPPRWVRLGDLKPEGPGDHSTAQDFRIVQRLAHPEYRYPLKDYDVALLGLDRDAVFNEYVRPACLYTSPQVTAKYATATGWGKTENAGWSEELRKVQLPLTDQAQCVSIFQKLIDSSPNYRSVLPNGIMDSMLCAGEPAGGKDTCQGDSGGPLQLSNESPFCTYSILGLVSFGKGCAQPGYPAVYTNVASFVPWIESIVWP